MSNLIFVWQAYGTIKVFDANSSEDRREILKRIIAELSGWEEQDRIERHLNAFEKADGRYSEELRIINSLLNGLGIQGLNNTAEAFELTGFVEVQELTKHLA